MKFYYNLKKIGKDNGTQYQTITFFQYILVSCFILDVIIDVMEVIYVLLINFIVFASFSRRLLIWNESTWWLVFCIISFVTYNYFPVIL